MADIPSLRIGDTLKVPYTIEALIQDQPSNRPVRVDEGLWLRRELVEAAEHIPAPRVFKRGDWVQYDDQRHGWVNYVRGGDVLVAWPEATQLFAYTPEELEPDEAPE